MNKPILTTCASALCLIGFASAQQVSISLSCPTPLTASLTNPPTAGNTFQVPAGLIPANGYYPIGSLLPGASSGDFLTWSTSTNQDEASFIFDQRSGGGPVTFGPNEILVEIQSSSPTNATLRLESFGVSGPGISTNSYSIDFRDDGSIEVDETLQTLNSAEFSVALSQQPLPIRIRATTAALASYVQTSLGIFVRPDNGVDIEAAAAGCNSTSFDLNCAQQFGGADVRFDMDPGIVNLGIPNVLVLSLGVDPILLPGTNQGLPCLLLPSPEAVLTTSSYDLQIPAAVRPIRVWAQSVYLRQGALRTTTAYRLTAQ
ncbi:MAG: hypothetical protein AB8H80_06165 [Planctomycetota bacterium]